MKGDVVDIFTNNIDMSDTEASEDLLGRTYEYCIAQFAEKRRCRRWRILYAVQRCKNIGFHSSPLITAGYMIVVVVLAVCLYRVKNLLKHIAIKEVQFLFMDRKLTRILGKWQK